MEDLNVNYDRPYGLADRLADLREFSRRSGLTSVLIFLRKISKLIGIYAGILAIGFGGFWAFEIISNSVPELLHRLISLIS